MRRLSSRQQLFQDVGNKLRWPKEGQSGSEEVDVDVIV